MKNNVTLVGFVGTNPETRISATGASVTTLSLATSRPLRDADGKVRKDDKGYRVEETEWHRITCFNGIGKAVAENIGKGAMLFVQGRIHYSRWTDSEGQQRYGCEIVAEQIDFLSRGKRSGSEDEIVREMALPL
jgi:single-strand DNA-binding protein